MKHKIWRFVKTHPREAILYSMLATIKVVGVVTYLKTYKVAVSKQGINTIEALDPLEDGRRRLSIVLNNGDEIVITEQSSDFNKKGNS